MKKTTFFLVIISLILAGCEAPNQALNQTATSTAQTPATTTVAAVPPPPGQEGQVMDNVEFDVKGDLIAGWYWVRNYTLTSYAAWTLHNVPTDQNSIAIDLEVLATNRSSGGPGYDANFLLYYGKPGGTLYSKRVVLPNVSPKGDPVGYTCKGTVLIPKVALAGGTDLYLKAVRTDKTHHHIAFKKESILNVAVSQEQSDLAGDDQTGQDQDQGGQTVAALDSDNDGVTDKNETLYGLNKNNADTDGDGIGDGFDLSPLLNPAEPTLLRLQRPGMIRITQPIKAVGFDGWVDRYYKHYRPFSSYYTFEEFYEDEGTKKSQMTDEKYKSALNKVFASNNFTCYKLDNVTPADLAVGETELTHDYAHEHDYIYRAGWTHPNEYRFYYDRIIDFQRAYLKNNDHIMYPEPSNYFKYIYQPIKLKTGFDQSLTLQFKSPALYQALSYADDKNYKMPALLYSLYLSDDFNDDNNTSTLEGIGVALIESENNFQINITIPKSKATLGQVYLKLTPVWAENKNGKINYSPLDLTWDLTGISRSVTYLQQSNGSSKVLTQEVKDFAALNNEVPALNYFSGKTGTAGYQVLDQDLEMITFDPKKTSDKYTVIESDNKIQTYTDTGMGTTNGFISLTENMVKADWKVDSLGDLPASHWARSAKYGAIAGTLSVTTGVVSMISDGQSAWRAYKDGNTVDVVYYSARTATTGVSTAVTLAEVSTKTFGYAGKASKFAKLTSSKVAVGLAVAVGTVEIAYNGYQLANTNDPILKLAYQENIAASTVNTGISIAAVFVPHALVFQITWSVEAELYAFIFGEDFAYKIAQSPGSAVVFLAKYFVTGGIDSHMAESAYLDSRQELIDQMEVWNDAPLPYLTIFIDPDL